MEATPVRRGSGSQASRSARPRALNAASARWWSLRPVPRRWSVAPAVRANEFEGVLDELQRQAADALAPERQVDDRVGTAADVDDRGARPTRPWARSCRRSGGCPHDRPAPPRTRIRGRARRPRRCGARRSGGRRRPGSRGRTARGARASPGGGRRSRSRCRWRCGPAPSRPSVTVMSVSRVVRATVTRRSSRGPMVSSPSGVVMRATPSCWAWRRPRSRARRSRWRH